MTIGNSQSSLYSLETFLTTCPDMLFVADEAGALLRWSDPLARALNPRLTQGTPLSDLTHPEDRDALLGAWSRLRETTEPVRFDVRLLGAEGIITGIRPAVAQTMVTLGLDLTTIVTRANLRAGLKYCLQRVLPS